MSATSLILRRDAPKRVMTWELRRRGRLSLTELGQLTGPVLVVVGMFVLAIPAIGSETTGGVIAGVILFTAAFVALVIGVVRAAEGDAMTPVERQEQIFYARSRKRRVHRDIEKTRLRDLRSSYSRYSVWVEASSKQIKVSILRHDRTRWGVFIRFNASKQRKGYDTKSQRWLDAEVAQWTISNPDAGAVEREVTRAAEMAEAMEESAYQDALDLHKVEALALAQQPPPASPRTQRKLEEKL